MCVLILYISLSETFLIRRRIQRDIIIYIYIYIYIYIHICLHLYYPLLLSYFNNTSIFSTDFQEIHKYQILYISVKVEPSSMRTDLTKLIVAFRRFANAPKISQLLLFWEMIALVCDELRGQILEFYYLSSSAGITGEWFKLHNEEV